MFKFKKRKRKEIYNIAKTATWDVGEKYPDDMLHKNRMSVWIGNFNSYRDQKMFMKQFRKFATELEQKRNRHLFYIFH